MSTEPATRPEPPRRRHLPAAPAGLRAGAGAAHVRVLQLRGLLHDHLDPVRLPDALRVRHEHRRPRRHRLGLADRRSDDPLRRPGHGRGLLQLPDRRRPLLLGGEAGQAERGRPGPGSPAGSTSSARSPSPPASTSAPRSSSTRSSTCSSASTRRPWHTILLFGLILLLHGALNQFGVRIVALLNDISVWWHVIGVAVIVGVLAFVPDHHQSASFVFGEFVNNTGWSRASTSRCSACCSPSTRYRLRRLGAHDRGDPRRRPRRPARHRHVDRRLASSPAGSC